MINHFRVSMFDNFQKWDRTKIKFPNIWFYWWLLQSKLITPKTNLKRFREKSSSVDYDESVKKVFELLIVGMNLRTIQFSAPKMYVMDVRSQQFSIEMGNSWQLCISKKKDSSSFSRWRIRYSMIDLIISWESSENGPQNLQMTFEWKIILNSESDIVYIKSITSWSNIRSRTETRYLGDDQVKFHVI